MQERQRVNDHDRYHDICCTFLWNHAAFSHLTYLTFPRMSTSNSWIFHVPNDDRLQQHHNWASYSWRIGAKNKWETKKASAECRRQKSCTRGSMQITNAAQSSSIGAISTLSVWHAKRKKSEPAFFFVQRYIVLQRYAYRCVLFKSTNNLISSI